MSLPKPKMYCPSMDELYDSHHNLYNMNADGRRQLIWEKLWDTTNTDYGRFSMLRGNPSMLKNNSKLSSPARSQLFSRHLSSTSVDSLVVSSNNSSPPRSPCKTGQLSSASVDILRIDNDDDAGNKRNPTSPVIKQGLSSPVAAKRYGLRKPGAKLLPSIMPVPSIKEHTNGFTRGISAIDRSRPNLTSGYAKNYVASTENIFWENIKNIRN